MTTLGQLGGHTIEMYGKENSRNSMLGHPGVKKKNPNITSWLYISKPIHLRNSKHLSREMQITDAQGQQWEL
jgi:hypothetical protein